MLVSVSMNILKLSYQNSNKFGELLEFKINIKSCGNTNKVWPTHLLQIDFSCFPAFWNVASARESDFTAQMIWWYCAVAHVIGNIGLSFACSQTGLLVIAKPNLVGLCRLSELYAKVDDKRLGKSVSDILCLIACSNKQAAIHLRMRSDELDFKSSRSRRQNLTTAI